MAFELKMTDAEHAAKIKELVMDLNNAVGRAHHDDCLEVVFDTVNVRHFGGGETSLLTVTVRRPL